jgi:phage gp29-like protein
VVKGDWQPIAFHNVSHRRFLLASGNQLELIVSGSKAVPLKAGQWAVSQRPHHNLARAGLLRTAAWWALFKRMSVRDWVVFAERFGIPFAIGVYEDRAGEDAKAALEQALSQLGNAGQVVVHEATKIVFSDVAQRVGNTTVHFDLIKLCEAQMSKLINGATQNVEQGSSGSYAQAVVHETRAYELARADANALAAMFIQDIGRPFIRFNGYADDTAPPRLKMQVFQEMDPSTRSKVASRVANELGGAIDRGQLYDDLGLRLPARPEDALHGKKAATAAPGDDDVDSDVETPDAE